MCDSPAAFVDSWRRYRRRGVGPITATRYVTVDEVQTVSDTLVGWLNRLPTPANVDLRVSRAVLRRHRRRFPHADLSLPAIAGFCEVCRLRWQSGRGIRHRRCANAFALFAEQYVPGRRLS